VTPQGRRTLFRLCALALLATTVIVVAHFTGLDALFTRSQLRGLVDRSGGWGVAIYFAAWALGLFLHIPGLLFVAVGVLSWGRTLGGLAAYAGAFLAVLFSFTVVRTIGGRPLGELRHPRVRALLARVEDHPILTVAALRSFLMAMPALNYALALSPIGWRAHLIGTALGLIPSVAFMSALFGVLFA
jgi:uncharacterized membrane protein YdjX (TVP38/TMEM64 family)